MTAQSCSNRIIIPFKQQFYKPQGLIIPMRIKHFLTSENMIDTIWFHCEMYHKANPPPKKLIKRYLPFVFIYDHLNQVFVCGENLPVALFNQLYRDAYNKRYKD